MGMTIIEKIIGTHCGRKVSPGDFVDIKIDTRVARDFGGANVVRNILNNGLGVDDKSRTYFTFDCNPGGSDQNYAKNQQICRIFARQRNIGVFDVDKGIGTHLAIDGGLVVPGATFVSTDSHANIVGAIGAFGQGMGDLDIAHAWAHGRVWFKVPPSVKLILTGMPSAWATAKDLVLAVLRQLGAKTLLGCAAEFYGDIVAPLSLDGRITIASMATELAAITAIFPPNGEVIAYTSRASGNQAAPVFADPDAAYAQVFEINVDGLLPLISRPGHPEDVVEVKTLAGTKIDSALIGSCTNGRYEDIATAAQVLKGRKVAPGVVLKVVPSTDAIWNRCLDEGLIAILKKAGALIGNAGCAGCAAGQIGQNGPGEVTVSTGNRNFAGKQGKGEVYLASPATAAASAIAGAVATADAIPSRPAVFARGRNEVAASDKPTAPKVSKFTRFSGRVWIIDQDNIDTDMIYHNRYLTITEIKQMGQYTFDNLEGYEDFAGSAQPGDIVVVSNNFGAGSSRQQAVDCFTSLGIACIIAESFGAIYERNAINRGFPIITAKLIGTGLETGQMITVDLETARIELPSGETVQGFFSDIQMNIYKKGGLLNR